MAYRDPYADHYGQSNPYGGSANDFNPYTTPQQRHPTYDQGAADYSNHNYDYPGGYGVGSTQPAAPHRQATMRTFLTSNSENTQPDMEKKMTLGPQNIVVKDSDQTSGFDRGEFSAPPGNERGMRVDRNLWTRGSRASCLGRFCCCTIMVIVVLVISILLTLILWARPPAVIVSDPQPVTNGSEFQLTPNGLTINMGVNISVQNPNYFSLDLRQLKVDLFYPINNTPIGGGSSNNVNFGSHAQTNFTLPFSLTYQTSQDPNQRILLDIAQKCGVLGATSQLTIDFKITVGVRILFVSVSPSVSNSVSFTCPFDASDLSGLLGGISSGSS